MDIYCKELNYPLKLKGTVKSNHNHIKHMSKMLFRNNYKNILVNICLILTLNYFYKKKM